MNNYKKAKNWAKKIGKVKGVQAVFLSGSLAQDQNKSTADIDLFIITTPGQIWVTRFRVFTKLKRQRELSKPEDHAGKICPNHFITTENLQITQKNAYTANLFTHNIPLYDPQNLFSKFADENPWVKKFGESFENADPRLAKLKKIKKLSLSQRIIESILKKIQIWKIKKNPDYQIPKAEIVLTDTEIRFHPNPKHLNWTK